MELQLCELGHARQCPPSTTALAGRQACCAWRCPPSALALGAGSVDCEYQLLALLNPPDCITVAIESTVILHPARLPAVPSASCFKVQVFLLVFLAWLLPAIVLRSLEAQVRACL